MILQDCNSDAKAEIKFEPKGWLSTNDYVAKGFVQDAMGEVKYKLDGKWNSKINAIDQETGEEFMVAERHELPKNWDS